MVILGGGFAGLMAARGLARAPVDVTVVDRRNHHLFQPLLYQVATAALSAPDVATPIRRVLRRQRNATVLLASARRIDVEGRRVLLEEGELAYDFLIVATGATHSYFGRDEWARHAPGLKSLEDAFEIRRRVLLAWEAAERDPSGARERLTFVVVGGGPTGVELAGALAEIARHTMTRDFRRISPSAARVLLVEAGERVLPAYPPSLSEKARLQLERLGVEVRTKTAVTGVEEGAVVLGGERLAAGVVVWAAGVRASELARGLGAPLDRAGRVRVNPDLTVPGHPEVLVAGDLASIESGGKPVPGVAPAAMQMGRHAARNVARAARGEKTEPFRYVDKGTLATIGRKAAVAEIAGVRFWGFPAWVAWLTIHIFFLIGFRNRFVVLFEWAWAYLTYQRSARLIVESKKGADDAPAATG